MRDLDRRYRDLAASAPEDRVAREHLRAEVEALRTTRPAWLAPRRLADDLARDALLGPWLFAGHLEAWRATGDPDAAYLLGRLEDGAESLEWFERAVQTEPRHLWGWHGIAWSTGNQRTSGRSSRAFVAALELVANHHELMALAAARVRRLEEQQRYSAALQLAEDALALPGWDAADRATWRGLALRQKLHQIQGTLRLEVDGGRMEFKRAVDPASEGLWLAALELFGPDSGLPDSEALGLLQVVLGSDFGRSRSAELVAVHRALEGRVRTGQASERMRARLAMLAKELDGLALGNLIAPGPDGLGGLDPGEFQAALAWERGEYGAWLAAWKARLPAFLRAAGAERAAEPWVPPAIAALLAGAEPGSALAADPRALAAALTDAGWFGPAAALLARLPQAPEHAAADAALRRRIETGREVVDEWKRLIVDDAVTFDDVLARLDVLAQRLEGGPDLLASPVEDHFGLAGLVLPGPRTGPSPDAPALVGLAAWATRLGRIALLGHQMGTLDGTLRSVVGLEYVRGERLGAPFSGTVFWCQGMEVGSRFERAGVPIAGAALHPGYWVDIEVVRDMWEAWEDLRLARATLLEVPAPFPAPPSCAPGAELEAVPLLGESSRVSIAVLHDHPVEFEDLLELTATHEEGHLVDRERFLPLGRHWTRVLRFLIEANFSVPALMQRLEYRAELVAMCEVEDPRLALAAVLEHVEASERGGGNDLTPHGSGYTRLAKDLAAKALELLRERGGGPWGGLREGAYLRWQWHRVEPEALREIALALAREEGLVEG